jgi:hypothetical protein
MENLKEAFLGTQFRVFDLPIVIKIDKKSPALDELLRKHQVNEWAYITAWNPFAKVLSDEENDRRQLELKELLKDFICFEGEGVGTDPAWKPERSLLVLGIPKNEAMQIGKKFEQYAIVYGRIDEAAELIALFEFK